MLSENVQQGVENWREEIRVLLPSVPRGPALPLDVPPRAEQVEKLLGWAGRRLAVLLGASGRLSCTLPLQLQGVIMVASCVQMLVGFSGLIGFLMRFIGPLTIAPTITLVALPLFDSAGNDAGVHWGISTM